MSAGPSVSERNIRTQKDGSRKTRKVVKIGAEGFSFRKQEVPWIINVRALRSQGSARSVVAHKERRREGRGKKPREGRSSL